MVKPSAKESRLDWTLTWIGFEVAPVCILIAVGAFMASSGDTLARFGNTEFFAFGKLLSVIFLFLGFLVSVEAFSEVRIPFTRVVLLRRAPEPSPAGESRPGA